MSMFYQMEYRDEDTLSWEWLADFSNKQDAINAYQVWVEVRTEIVQIVEVDSEGNGKVLLPKGDDE